MKLATDKDKSAIISKLRIAIKKTDAHIENNRDKETEEDIFSNELMLIWEGVAELVRPYDRSLARIFGSKSAYWNNPRKFKEEIREGKRGFDPRFRLAEVKKIEAALENAWFG